MPVFSVPNVKAMLTATKAVRTNSVGFLFIVGRSSNTLFLFLLPYCHESTQRLLMKAVAHPLLDRLCLKSVNKLY